MNPAINEISLVLLIITFAACVFSALYPMYRGVRTFPIAMSIWVLSVLARYFF